MNLTEKDIQRFHSKYEPVTESGCWIWTAALNNHGYGAFGVGYKVIGAHRVSYQMYIGKLDKTDHVLHKCDNPCCVNPNHLFKGDQAKNMQDMAHKKRSTIGERNPQSKLTETQVCEIRNEVGMTQLNIAKKHGISQSAVSFIRNGKRWNK